MGLLKRLLLASLGGVLYFTGFVGFDLWPNIFVFWVPALVAIEGLTPKRTLLVGAVFGLVTNWGGYYWVVHLLQEFAGLALPLALLGCFLLCLYQGFLLAVVLWLVRLADRDLGVRPVWALTVAFVSMETVYPLLFPSYVGNALYQVPTLTQVADLFGMLGITALICLVNGALYELLTAVRTKRAPDRRALLLPAVVLAFTIGYGRYQVTHWEHRMQSDLPTLRVGMVQTNLGARDKAEKRSEFIRRHQFMTRTLQKDEPELDLVVWPESAYNRYVNRATKNLNGSVTKGIEVPLIFGALTYARTDDKRPEVYNTAVLTSSTGDVRGLFDKVELLMFGETIPFVETFPTIKEWFPRSSTFTRGRTFAHLRVDHDEGTAALLPMICYEDIIPSFVRRIWLADGPPSALVNVTNDSWYGDTNEPLIHLALATFRSIETRRSLIRSTNTGISAFVDPLGRITKRSGQWTRETLVHDVPLVTDGTGTLYMVVGDILGWLATGLVLFGLIRRRRRAAAAA